MPHRSSLPFYFAALGLFIYAIVARYWTVPSHQNYLELTSQGIEVQASVWIMLRYMIWVYAFKGAAVLFTLGIFKSVPNNRQAFRTVAILLVLYLMVAWIPLPIFASYAFAAGGILMSTLFVFSVIQTLNPSQNISKIANHLTDKEWLIVAMTVFISAIYTLCPLLGVAGYALEPELMIRWNLQDKANWFAANLMKDLVIVWVLLLLSASSQKSAN